MMDVEQLGEEQTRLTENLTQVQERIVDQWLTADVQTYMTEQKARHDEMMSRSRADMEALRTTLDQLKGQAKVNQQTLQERMEILRSMRTELEAVERDTDAVLREKEVAEGLLSQTRASVGKETELLTTQEKATQQRLVELEKSADWFKDRLGLRFKKATGNQLQFIFTCIHPEPQKQDRVFFFNVKISSDQKYIVSDCEPAVPDIEQLVEKLNVTNNLRSFVIEIRKRFKALATS